MRSKRIFWLDDGGDAVAGIKHILESYGGFEVTHVAKFREALQVIEGARQKGVWEYDLLILDLTIRAAIDEDIPEKDTNFRGLTLHDRFRSNFATERVLLLTNYLYAVPEALMDGPYTVARDKVDVRGRALLEVIKHWPGEQ